MVRIWILSVRVVHRRSMATVPRPAAAPLPTDEEAAGTPSLNHTFEGLGRFEGLKPSDREILRVPLLSCAFIALVGSGGFGALIWIGL